VERAGGVGRNGLLNFSTGGPPGLTKNKYPSTTFVVVKTLQM
jgi:hypothetical protein